MKKIIEVLRLKYAAGLSHEKIARACGLSKGTVNNYVSATHAQGMTWPLPEGLDEARLEALLFPPRQPSSRLVEPDYFQMHQALKRKGVTLQLLWAEYVAVHGERSYRYSQYCNRYRQWRERQRRSMRQVHIAGEKLFIDATARVIEQQLTDRPHPEHGYRACLGLLKLSHGYGKARLEAACERALAIGSVSYRSVASILKQGLDQQPLHDEEPDQTELPLHTNLRGPGYYH